MAKLSDCGSASIAAMGGTTGGNKRKRRLATFGEEIGKLVLARRTSAGWTQLELALEAFEDETKVRRIVELENGHVKRPQARTLGPLYETLNITPEEIKACKRVSSDFAEISAEELNALRDKVGTLSKALESLQKLTRDEMEAIAIRFEVDRPYLLSDPALRRALEDKAEDYRNLRDLVENLQDHVAIRTTKLAAQQAIEQLDFEEVERLLASAHIAELRIAAATSEARAQNALLRGRLHDAYKILTAAADSFGSLDPLDPARKRLDYEEYFTDHAYKYAGDGLDFALRIVRDAKEMVSSDGSEDSIALWASAMNRSGHILKVKGEHTAGAEGLRILQEAVSTLDGALSVRLLEKHPREWAISMMNLGNAYVRIAERQEDTSEALETFDKALFAFRSSMDVTSKDKNPVDWAKMAQNLGLAISSKASIAGINDKLGLLNEAIDHFEEAVEIFTHADYPLFWAIVTQNLGEVLSEKGEIVPGQEGVQLLELAKEKYEAARTVNTKSELPIEWAKNMENLAELEERFALHDTCDEPRAYLEAGIEHVSAALEIYVAEDLTYDIGTARQVHERLSERLASI